MQVRTKILDMCGSEGVFWGFLGFWSAFTRFSGIFGDFRGFWSCGSEVVGGRVMGGYGRNGCEGDGRVMGTVIGTQIDTRWARR